MTQVLDAPSGERLQLLDNLCGDDLSLRTEVRSLLAEVRREDTKNDNTDDSLRAVVIAEARVLSATRATTDVETLRTLLQQNLGQAYDIVSTLGVGGMGAVFLARERALDRFVAIKTLRAEQAMTVASRERFKREARIAAGLSHPGIMPLYAFGETGGMWYLVMGYVQGQSLAQRLQAEGRLSPEESWRILRALTDALDHAHRRQIIHRDIKPANILIDSESKRPLLSDFGISRVMGESDSLTQTGDVLGTPHFMSPEQLTSAHECTVQSDVYALGAVAYAMLSGRVPRAEVPGAELLARRTVPAIVPLDRLCPDIAPDFAALVMRCLATRPDDRWPGMGAMRDALDRIDQTIETTLPIAVRELSGFGAFAVVWFFFWMGTLLRVDATAKQAIVVLLALLVPLGLMLHIRRASSPAQRSSQLWQVAFWPPLWWGMWWPTRLRRPDDVWKRLPFPARIIRVVMSVFTVSLPILMLDQEWFARLVVPSDTLDNWYTVAGLIMVATVLALTATFFWSTRLRLARIDNLHFLFGPTAQSTFWRRPDVVRQLQLATPGVRPPDVQVPNDFVRAMLELQRVRHNENSHLLEAAIALARRIPPALTGINREITDFERDAPPAEVVRLNARLSALRNATPSTVQLVQHSALVTIVESEIALLHAIQQRKTLAVNDAVALSDVLKALWNALLRAEDYPGEHAAAESQVATVVRTGTELLTRLERSGFVVNSSILQ